MDWSPDRVLNFGPQTHRRGLQWVRRTNLLWPVYAWRVVTPELHDRPLNVLQRAVLRFQLTGTREHVRVGALLGIDAELVAFVAQELMQMDLLNNDFLVFTRPDSRDVNVVYRRKDGGYGLIQAGTETTLSLSSARDVTKTAAGPPITAASGK